MVVVMMMMMMMTSDEYDGEDYDKERGRRAWAYDWLFDAFFSLTSWQELEARLAVAQQGRYSLHESSTEEKEWEEDCSSSIAPSSLALSGRRRKNDEEEAARLSPVVKVRTIHQIDRPIEGCVPFETPSSHAYTKQTHRCLVCMSSTIICYPRKWPKFRQNMSMRCSRGTHWIRPKRSAPCR